MRTYTLFLFLLLFPGTNLFAQTIMQGVVTDASNVPVPFASVYLSKTTIGTMTNKDGAYSLMIPQNGEYELIASCIGYKTEKTVISALGKSHAFNIKMLQDLVMIDEVTVQSKDKNRIKNYGDFDRLFLGESVNAQNCKILNTKDLYFRKDAKTDIVKGHSLKPLQIENRSLGYTIIYDLTDFTYDAKSGYLSFTGNTYFLQMPGNAKENKKWHQHRLRTYYGSKMHFLRSLYSDSLNRENFKVSNFEVLTTKDKLGYEHQNINPLPENSLEVTRESDYMTLFSLKPILLSYYDNKPELSSALIGFEPREYQSTIQFSNKLKVYHNGYIPDPFTVTWQGAIGDERIADMLPDDFQLHAITNLKPDSAIAENPVDKYLYYQQKIMGSDQVFVQLDRNIYRPGDTIFFQAYIRNRFTGTFDSKSVSMYALLFDGNKTMVDSSRFRISNSTASGWMIVPLKAEVGKYHFAAFTAAMQNYDPVEAFQLDLYVREQNSNPDRVQIAFDKLKYLPGDTVEATVKIMDPKGNPINKKKFSGSISMDKYVRKSNETQTNEKGESLIRFTLPDSITSQPKLQVITKLNTNKGMILKNINIPCESQSFELRFLPEGGTFVEGIEQRVGFNATNLKGEPVTIKGLLKNSSGSILDTIQSGMYGPGSFVCKPHPGLYVEILNGAGSEKRWSLTVPETKGMTLSVSPVDNKSFAVEVQSSDYNGEHSTVSGVMNLTQVFSKEIILNKKQRFLVDTEQLPSGVITITLFDKLLKPIAERLFYVNSDQRLRYNIQTVNQFSHPGEDTELSIAVTDGQGKPTDGIFSLAVTDSVDGIASDLYTPGIEYTYNYHPAFPGNLPAKVLAKGVENLTDEDRNLLLMVYGWSKFNWDFPKEKSAEILPSDYENLSLEILYALKKNKGDRSMDLVSLEGPSMLHLTTNKAGKISLPLDSLPEITKSVMIMPAAKNKNKAKGSKLSIPYNEQYFKSNKLFVPQPTLSSNEYSIAKPYRYISMDEKMIEIPEVIINGHAGNIREYHDEYEERYQNASVHSLDSEVLWSSTSLEAAIRKLVCPFLITNDAIYLRPPVSLLNGPVPALFVLDGMALYSQGWYTVNMILPSEITSLTILSGPEGFVRYGPAAQQGVIFVNTRSTNPNLLKNREKWLIQLSNNKMLLPITLYRPNVECYNPNRQDLENDPLLQNRATILWHSELHFEGNTPVKIRIPNLNHTGSVVITINGVSVDNLVGTGRASYQVQ